MKHNNYGYANKPKYEPLNDMDLVETLTIISIISKELAKKILIRNVGKGARPKCH